MKKILSSIVILAIFSQMGCAKKTDLNSFEENSSASSNIVGGTAAKPNEFAFIASLQSSNSGHFCGGSLIAPKWVLTAAHCVTQGVGFVYLGLHSQKNKTGARKVAVKNVIVHPQRNDKNHNYDFALLELAEAQTSQIALLPPNDNFTDNLIAKKQVTSIAGWGKTKPGMFSSGSDILQKAFLPLVNCSLIKDTDESMLCAGYEKAATSGCHGDSGGPLIVRAPGGTPYLLGVTSWGPGGTCSTYTIYGKVNFVTAWINNIIK